MKTKLITALRTAATALEDGTFFYKWTKQSCCNCGVLFCALTGKSAAELDDEIPELIEGGNATWKMLVGQHCPITGIPTQKLFRELLSYGLTQKDMVNLEYLSDSKVIARMKQEEPIRKEPQAQRKWYQLRAPKLNAEMKKDRDKLDYQNKKYVIAYMRAWADLLTEEGAMDVAEPAEVQHAQ
jgi:hypothetical protein